MFLLTLKLQSQESLKRLLSSKGLESGEREEEEGRKGKRGERKRWG
jgi:hypothetical protein